MFWRPGPLPPKPPNTAAFPPPPPLPPFPLFEPLELLPPNIEFLKLLKIEPSVVFIFACSAAAELFELEAALSAASQAALISCCFLRNSWNCFSVN